MQGSVWPSMALEEAIGGRGLGVGGGPTINDMLIRVGEDEGCRRPQPTCPGLASNELMSQCAETWLWAV